MQKKTSQQSQSSNQQKIGKTIINDFRSGDLPQNLIQDLKDLYQFYIDTESKKELAQMGRVRRWLKSA